MSEDAINAVPRALREAAYGLGATKLEVSLKVVLPAALSGIAAAVIVGISRAVGETMIVALAAGAGPNFTFNPFQGAETITGHIVRISGGDLSYDSIDYNSIFALALFLFTAVAGRLWCGYACPQTVYSEIFMWIERRIEGDRNKRILLDRARAGTPLVFDYRAVAAAESMQNTPPTFGWYFAGLVFRWLKREGGLAGKLRLRLSITAAGRVSRCSSPWMPPRSSGQRSATTSPASSVA